jgi:hypothetical protein
VCDPGGHLEHHRDSAFAGLWEQNKIEMSIKKILEERGYPNLKWEFVSHGISRTIDIVKTRISSENLDNLTADFLYLEEFLKKSGLKRSNILEEVPRKGACYCFEFVSKSQLCLDPETGFPVSSTATFEGTLYLIFGENFCGDEK